MTGVPPSVIVVGAGHAGAEAAVAVRQGGYTGDIVLIGAEPGLPYHRPPLSKAYLAGSATARSLELKPAAAYEKARLSLRLGVRVESIDRPRKLLTLSDRTQLAYTQLILATGSRPRPWHVRGLGDPSAAPANLFYLRTQGDSEAIRGCFAAGRRLVIIGGGYIGLEVAATARQCGLDVTLLEAQPRILARVTAATVSAFYASLHREAGVDIRVGVQVERVVLDAAGQKIERVITCDGDDFAADLVLAGIGALPNVELAGAAGLDVDNGIVVDEYTRTSDPDILAIGDCSNHPNALYGRRIRLESVPNALEQARIAAGVVCGAPLPYASIPWFWSDQYGLKLQMAGLAHECDTVVMRGSPQTKSFAAFSLQHGTIRAVDCVNRLPEFAFAKRLVAAQARIAPERLADEGITLKELVAGLNA